MNLKKISMLCLAASTAFAASSAMAWESADGAWSTSANVALSSEYVFRGITQTDSDPAISGGFDLNHTTGAYAGAWASNVDFGDDASIEIDYYAGFASDIADTGFSYDVGAIYYDYPGASDLSLDFTEVYGSLSYSFLTAGVAYTIDADDKNYEDSVYYSLDAAHDIGMFSLAAGVGYYDYDFGEDYTNYHVGVSTEVVGLGVDLTYTDTDNNGDDLFGTAADSTFIFTVSKSM
ncbi:hypothetical protein LCGC14_0733320 [marine sediment metagenome]|uniref:Porin domain-containing protein n=1 Tax=marine sediment metagenome TaxID=412755 RepID=A0A0F9QTU9_9ZZZZ|nr:hypothetical protein [Methylophaga sp.]HEC58631.1 hypothetical protein [Methylophaga sp.]